MPYDHKYTKSIFYLSAYPSSLGAFMIRKNTVFQKPRGRQLTRKVCGSKRCLFCQFSFVQNALSNKDDYLKTVLVDNHCHFSIELMTLQRSKSTQHLYSFKFTLVNKSHSKHSMTAVHCVGHHFLICTQ